MNSINEQPTKTSEIDGNIQRLNIVQGKLKDALRVLSTRLQSVSAPESPQENQIQPPKEPCYSPMGTAIQEAADAAMDMHGEVHGIIDRLMI
jgi:hypothetical protein